MSLQSFINNTLDESQIEYKCVLDPENKCELQEHIYNVDDENLNNKCPITMGLFQNEDNIIKLPCGHLFNSEAIEEWVLNNQAKCPVCRYQLKHTKEIKLTPLPTSQIIDSSNNESSNSQTQQLIRSFMNYIINGSMNEIYPNNNISNIFNNDISENPIQNDISENPIQNDPILNSMNRYLSSINNIINRQIEQEDNHIMQEAILASLREK
jgi:hypothetical protein